MALKRKRDETDEAAPLSQSELFDAGHNLSQHRFVVDVPFRVAVVVLERKRPGFDPEWGKEMRARALQVIAEVAGGFGAEMPSVFVAPGPVNDDASLREAIVAVKAQAAEVLVVIQPTISDGRLSGILAQKWGDAPILFATPEKQEGAMISANSLVGTHVFAATLRQLGRPFEFVYGNLDWDAAASQLRRGMSVCAAARRLKQAKIGLIGYHAPGFVDLHPDVGLMNRTFGTQLLHIDLQEFLEVSRSFSEEEVLRDVAEFKKLGLPLTDVTEEDLPQSSRAFLAMKKLCETEMLDALAIRCWPELPVVLGQWVYVAIARAASSGLPTVCEGDVDGALSCLVGKLLHAGSIYISDWLEHSHDTVTTWHGGIAPFQLSQAIGCTHGPRVSRHFNNKKPLVCESTLKLDMDVTVFRFWVCEGKYSLFLTQGKTVNPTRHLMGTNGSVKLENVNLTQSFEQLLHLGMPHHVCIVNGHHYATFQALARRLGIPVYPASLR